MKILSVVLSLICLIQSTFAKDFGTNGHTYKITEQPFLKMIDERLAKVDFESERSKMEKIAKERIKNPTPIAFITPAKETKVFYFDPTYELLEDAVLPSGEILHKAGTTVNPLDHMTFDRMLIFIDAREKNQIAWVKDKLKEAKPSELFENKIILIAGSPLELEEELREKVYFDQQGALTKRFGIAHTPALVEALGKQLKITELHLNEER